MYSLFATKQLFLIITACLLWAHKTRPSGFLAPKDFKIIWLSNIVANMSAPDEVIPEMHCAY